MIEKVAQALWDAGLREDWDVRVALATAAVQAMRYPDNTMLRAACGAMSPGKRPTKARVSVKAKHGIRYRAMIDAALTKGKQMT